MLKAHNDAWCDLRPTLAGLDWSEDGISCSMDQFDDSEGDRVRVEDATAANWTSGFRRSEE